MEIIVVDGGSTDGTIEIAAAHVRVYKAPRGRGIQMNTGTRFARGDVYWFIHADCFPHSNSLNAILQTLKNRHIAGGGFEYILDSPGWIYRISEILSNRKNRKLNWLFGDMGIFVRKEVFDQMGGFRSYEVLEDMDFCKRLKNHGMITILPLPMTTSARRWKQEGPVKNITRNWFLQFAWSLGISPTWLAKWYQFGNNHADKIL